MLQLWWPSCSRDPQLCSPKQWADLSLVGQPGGASQWQEAWPSIFTLRAGQQRSQHAWSLCSAERQKVSTHTCTNTVECCRPRFPTQRNYSTDRQTGPSVCCFWPHGFLCQESATLNAARRLHSAYSCRNMITAAKTLKMKNQILLVSITGGSC